AALSLWHLDRLPVLQEDEPWILSPGYKLFTRGTYGSDLFAGLCGMERHYLEFMPLMSLLEGAVARVLGFGVVQMRLVPVALGVATVALAWRIARSLAGPAAAGLTALLLLLWQWGPGRHPVLATGIPLVDLCRSARYDILVAPLGLAAWWFWHRSRRPSGAFLAGTLAGLAGLAHLYGLFWIAALGLDHIAGPAISGDEPDRSRIWRLLAGALLPCGLWGGYALSHWSDLRAQMWINRREFDLTRAGFFIESLLNEAHRYALGVRHPETLLRAGFWLLVLGVPAALVWLSARAFGRRDRASRALVIPSLVLPLLLALLVRNKRFDYLASVAPLFAILLGWGLARLIEARGYSRAVAVALLGILGAQGAWAIARAHRDAARLPAPANLFRALRLEIAPGSRVLGRLRYWIALRDAEYRAFGLPFLLSDPRSSPVPISLEEALSQTAPDFVLIDAPLARALSGDSSHAASARRDEFWAYMRRRGARLVREIPDVPDGPLRVYRLGP
ncbi:MAG: hypothetical protein DMG07_03445, partial [Acidobacteria bacterium]